MEPLPDLVGLSDDELKNLIDDCFECLVADVVAFGGQVDKIIGDAILALFGAPIAHEDDAERAVRAALRMQQSIAQHTADLPLEIRMRVGPPASTSALRETCIPQNL